MDNLVLEISATPYIFTFKMCDWVRLDLDGKMRPLNIGRAFANLYFERKGERVGEELVAQPYVRASGPDWQIVHQPTHSDHFYDVERLEFAREIPVVTNDSCQVMSLVEGESVILETAEGMRARFNYAETFIVPAAAGRFRLINEGSGPARVVKAFVKPLSAWPGGGMTRYVLGIDGGGTKTQAAIVDETGHVRGVGLGGPSNYDDIGANRARANIAQAVTAACAPAGCEPAPFAAAFLGLAGIVSPADRAVVQGIAADLRLAPLDRVGVDHDCRIALAGGLSGRPGIVLIAGTGSSCYGRNAAGGDWRAGGWGSQIGDEGSGYWLGLHALQSAVRAYDGRGPATRLEADVRRVLDQQYEN